MAVVLLALVSVIQLTARGVGAATHWGSFAKDKCVQSQYRKYYSRLWDISGDWKKACSSTPARVGPENVYFEKPDVCVDKGIGGMWGEFHVRDTTCDPTWGSFKDDGCRGSSGLRQYSSILRDIQGSWEGWCAATPATVRGILFPYPTRCVNKVFNMWGEFDVYDPCCSETKSGHDLLLALCFSGGGGDEPPFPNPRKVNSPAGAITILKGKYDPLDLIEYLWTAYFQTIVRASTANATNFYAIESDSYNPHILRFQGTLPSPSTPYAQIRALLVPTILGSSLVNNGGVFPPGTFATIDLARPPAPIICTQQLTGCCMAFGWDNSNSRLYMGHVEPDGNVPAVSNRADVANFLRSNPVFPGSTQLLYRESFGGDAEPTGYEGLRVNIIGFVAARNISILLQMTDNSRNIVRRRLLVFRRQ